MEPEFSLPHSQQPAITSPFHCLGCTVGSVRFRFLCVSFVTGEVVTVRSCWHVAQPKAGGPPLVGSPRLLVQCIRSFPPYLEAVPPAATWGRTMPLWQHWAHLLWHSSARSWPHILHNLLLQPPVSLFSRVWLLLSLTIVSPLPFRERSRLWEDNVLGRHEDLISEVGVTGWC